MGVFLVSLMLVLASAFFVAAEYALVSSRKSRFEALARQGHRRAEILAKELDNLGRHVAGIQIALTMIGIGVGAVTEPLFNRNLQLIWPQINHGVSYVIAFLSAAFLMVVAGELVPKYATLQRPERIAIALFPLLQGITQLLSPLIWIAQTVAGGILKIFGVSVDEERDEIIPKDELLLLVRSGGVRGVLEKRHADVVARALRLDVLTARDIMVHRIDIEWLDLSCNKQEVLERLKPIAHTRIPVCRGDIDDLAGIIHLHDVVKHLDDAPFVLENLVLQPVIIPENLTLERVVQTMRTEKTHMLIVADEYGGTSGIVTLEDVIEEIFGDLEDRGEADKPSIMIFRSGRVIARAEVRIDELVAFLELPIEPDQTDSLANLIVESLERVPTLGDQTETSLGRLRVDNMARQRITWVSLQLKPELLAQVPPGTFTDFRRRER